MNAHVLSFGLMSLSAVLLVFTTVSALIALGPAIAGAFAAYRLG